MEMKEEKKKRGERNLDGLLSHLWTFALSLCHSFRFSSRLHSFRLLIFN